MQATPLLSIRDAEYEGEPSYHYRLIFRTSGIIEKVYKMRDTIDCHLPPTCCFYGVRSG